MTTRLPRGLIVLAASILSQALSTPAHAFPAGGYSDPQETTPGRQLAREMEAEQKQEGAENKEFLERFRTLSPEERVNIWKQSSNAKYQKSVAFRIADKIQDLLIIEGTDTAPQLAVIVRDRKQPYSYRFWAMRILVDMDRYIPEADFPMGAVETLSIKQLNLSGAVNPFLQVTGRRIGDEGRKSLEWAAKEADDKWLQFFTRDNLGLVEQELGGYTIDEQVRRWRDLAAHTNGTEGRPESFLRRTLSNLIVERAPDSLPALVNLLNNDKDRAVRSAVVGLIGSVDYYRFRLRKTDLGRSAIEDIHKALIRREVKLNCLHCDTPEAAWTEISNRFNNDNFVNFDLNPGTLCAHYAQMLHVLYGEDTIRVVPVGTEVRQEWAIPEFAGFITFLTDKDPFFPSWEYTYFGPLNSEAFHPLFAEKMARIEDAWKQYEASRTAAPVK